MSISIYRPYFYIIQHIDSGKYYAGVKYAKNANPDNLLRPDGYQTSSDIIKQIILEEGLESFVIKKIKIFETGAEALDYESRFLRKVNAAFNMAFLNKCNNSISTLNVDRYKTKQTMLERYGVEHPSQVPEFQEKQKQTCLGHFGCSYPAQSEEVRIKIKQTNLNNYGCENVFQNEDIKEKSKKTNLEKFGYESAMQSPEIKEKKKQTCLEKYGVEYPVQLPEIKEKKKQTCLEKYGCESHNSAPHTKESKRKIISDLLNQPIIIEIIKYRDKFKLKLGANWYYKKHEILDKFLGDLKMIYGDIIS